MDARRARFLRDARDQLFNLFAHHHHQVREFVDHHHNQWHFVQRLGACAVFGGHKRIHDRRLRFVSVAHFLVKACEVAHAHGRHQLVAPLHLAHAPVQGMRRLPHVRYHWREQMRNAFVDRQLQHLRVDQYQAHLRRRRFVEQRQNHGVDRHRFTRPRGARHQQVRHAAQVSHHRMPGDVFAHRQRERRTHVGVDLRAQNLGELHHLPPRIGNLQPHATLAGYGFHHPYAHHRQRACQIAHEVSHLAALHTHRRLDFVARHHRPRIGGHHLHRHAKVTQFFLDQARGEFQRFGRHGFEITLGFVQQMQRRQHGIWQIFK